jgi:hypothetical protein
MVLPDDVLVEVFVDLPGAGDGGKERLGLDVAPMLLPDYSNPEVRTKQLTTKYTGTLR